MDKTAFMAYYAVRLAAICVSAATIPASLVFFNIISPV